MTKVWMVFIAIAVFSTGLSDGSRIGANYESDGQDQVLMKRQTMELENTEGIRSQQQEPIKPKNPIETIEMKENQDLHRTGRSTQLLSSASGFTAVVFGSRHIRTFDGSVYDFPGYKHEDCTYLLTRDSVSRNFTLLSTMNSVTLLTPDFAVTIDKSNRVKVNNTDVYSDLPIYSYWRTVVVSQHASSISIHTTYGITLHCKKGISMCRIHLDEDTKNQTLGLLGTNDDEQANDKRMRNNELTNDIHEFVNSYEVSGQQRCRYTLLDEVQPRLPVCRSAEYPKCQQFFSDNTSPLKNCFSLVDPTPFKESCQSDSSVCNPRNPSPSVCDGVEAYVSICQSAGASVSHPSHCGKCGKRNLDSTWKVTSRKQLDIVIVLSTESPTSTSDSSSTHYLNPLIHRLKRTLKKSGYTDVRYGLVTLGCYQSEQFTHMHTINGKLLNSHHFLSHLNEMIPQLPTSGCSRDAREAVKLTALYPFRDVASRFVFLLTESEPQDSSTRQLLEERLLQQDIIFSAATTQTEQSQSVGLYHHLASATGGATYNIDVIRRKSRRHILDVSQQITEAVTSQQNARCRQCVCERAPGGSGYPRCRRTKC